MDKPIMPNTSYKQYSECDQYETQVKLTLQKAYKKFGLSDFLAKHLVDWLKEEHDIVITPRAVGRYLVRHGYATDKKRMNRQVYRLRDQRSIGNNS